GEWGAEKIGLQGGGALCWAEGADAAGRERLKRRAAHLQAWDYPVTTLNRTEMLALEPRAYFRTAAAEGAEGLFAPADRWVDTPRLLRFFVERIRERTGDIRPHCPATGFTRDIAGFISTVETPQGRIGTRHLILAAGAQTPELLPSLGGGTAEALRAAFRR